MKNFNKSDTEDIILRFENDNKDKNKIAPSHVLTPDEVLSDEKKKDETTVHTGKSPLNALKERMLKSNSENITKVTDAEKPKEKTVTDVNDSSNSLLDKLKRYTIDENGKDLSQNDKPLYELQSVADIIKTDGERALKSLSKKYNISIDNLKKSKQKNTNEISSVKSDEVKGETSEKAQTERVIIQKDQPTPTPAFEKMVTDAQKRNEKEILNTFFPPKKNKEENVYETIPDISDTDIIEFGVNNSNKSLSNTATIRFTPVKLDGEGNNIRVSSATRSIDISEELSQIPDDNNDPKDTVLQKTDFEMFVPETEAHNPTDAKKLIRRIAIYKRNAFVSTLVSGLMLFILSLFSFGPLWNVIVGNPKVAMIICGIFLSISFVSNFDMLGDFLALFKNQASHDVIVGTASVFSIALCFISSRSANSVYYFILACAITLFLRALCKFYAISAKLGNLKQVTASGSKVAVKLIGDSSTTFAMAKNSIEGDVLISAPQKTNFINDFMKYSEYGTKFSGKMGIVFFAALILAAISATAAALYFRTLYHAVYSATAILLLAALPTLIFIDSLPHYVAAKRLNKKGAMIAGKHGATSLELSNAAVISSHEIFPDGYITLQDMKVLSDNNIDDTLLCAAALTTEMDSTLAPIFCRIAGTNDSYKMPNATMTKYEERLGISGWVNNKMLFIGNRTIMEGHGITVPSIEYDRQILRNGYFPVYLAADGKACALLIIKYSVSPEVIKELHRVTKLGVTLLVSNCDPNISEVMISDYFDLYEDSVKVMSNAGVHMFKNATQPSESISAPAMCRRNSITFISILNCASRIKQSNILLTVIYTLCSIFGILYFVYASFSSGSSLLDPVNLLLYELGVTALSIIAFIFKKP